MKKTIFKQLTLIYTSLSLFLLLSVGIYFLSWLHRDQFHNSIEKTNLLWKHLSGSMEDISNSLNSPDLNEKISNLSASLKAKIFIYDKNDRVIVRYENGQLDDSEYKESTLEITILSQLKSAFPTVEGKHFNSGEYFVSSYPIFFKSQINGYFVIIQNKGNVLNLWVEFFPKLIQIIAFVFTIALIIFILFAKRLVYPIKHLSKVASLINVKNMDIPIIDSADNEIGDLAVQFRQMSHNLKESICEINTQKEMLVSIMNAIRQAIWIVDENACIVMYNELFAEISKHKELKGKYLFDILRNHELIKILQDTLKLKQHFTEEIEIEDKIFLCTSSYINTNKNIVFTLLDISDIKAIEKLKKDFISNVSHELKTPLTAIKGFVETMLEDIREDSEHPENYQAIFESQAHYLEIVNRNTNRLIYIVNDLLSLSRLEQNQELHKEIINVQNLLERIQVIFTDRLKENQMQILIQNQNAHTEILADEYQLEQVFINLIDNAIKYAGKGKIEISLENQADNLLVKVKDQGDGIKAQHLKRIFERFYVVDSSRSKRMGGTGLGLSIVKHIVYLHHGEILVESTENIGTCFTVSLPLK
ncbi:MAG TPA: ATP-binding protein [Candidatus Cloacimonadota bacterium]|nr:ATP-binding protein [Candidatus Cloacimonadota bacterium]HPM01219.1 ATP-binding protein [Candidatus Cloacimonadota bacterium]